jgi:hypothetical protein
MEGFEPERFDKILGLTDYTSVVLATFGYRSPTDGYAALAKVRYPKSEVLVQA